MLGTYRRADLEHLRKEALVTIVQSDFSRWPQCEDWHSDPLAPRAKPTTKTLKRIIVDYGFSRLSNAMENVANADVLDGTSDDIVGDTVGDTTGHAVGSGNLVGARDTAGAGDSVGAGDTVGNPAYTGNLPTTSLSDTVCMGNTVGNTVGTAGNTAVIDTMPETVGDVGKDVLDDAVDAMDATNGHADGIASATHIPAPENESTIARILRETIQADPEMADDFDYFLRSRNRKLTSHETILICQFAIRFNDAWFQNHLQVEGVKVLVLKKHILEVLRYSPAWFSESLEIVDLVKRLSRREEMNELKTSHKGRRALILYLKKLLEV